MKIYIQAKISKVYICPWLWITEQCTSDPQTGLKGNRWVYYQSHFLLILISHFNTSMKTNLTNFLTNLFAIHSILPNEWIQLLPNKNIKSRLIYSTMLYLFNKCYIMHSVTLCISSQWRGEQTGEIVPLFWQQSPECLNSISLPLKVQWTTKTILFFSKW